MRGLRINKCMIQHYHLTFFATGTVKFELRQFGIYMGGTTDGTEENRL